MKALNELEHKNLRQLRMWDSKAYSKTDLISSSTLSRSFDLTLRYVEKYWNVQRNLALNTKPSVSGLGESKKQQQNQNTNEFFLEGKFSRTIFLSS